VKAAGLVDTLQGAGPFTVFAPTNAAFGKLPAGTVDNLVKPENKGTLTSILTYHVVPGRMTAASLMKAVKDGEGWAKLKTVQGEELTVKQAGPGKLTITDAKGDTATVTVRRLRRCAPRPFLRHGGDRRISRRARRARAARPEEPARDDPRPLKQLETGMSRMRK